MKKTSWMKKNKRSSFLKTFDNNLDIKITFTFIIALVYAILRYNVFGNVPWEEIPLFITNKAISLTTVFLMLFTLNKQASKDIIIKLWKSIFVLTSIHVLISFLLLGPEYYNKFYFENELNIVGYSTVLWGILAFIGILMLNFNGILPTKNGKLTLPNSLKKWVRKIIPFLIGGHLFSMGINGWISPNNWHGYLLPISLIGFIAITIFIIKNRVSKTNVTL
jgi:hypothetical protein